MKTKIVNDCEVTLYQPAGPGRNSPARYVVHFHSAVIGTLEKYRGAGQPWQASDADCRHRGAYYGRGGLECAVASLRAAAAGV